MSLQTSEHLLPEKEANLHSIDFHLRWHEVPRLGELHNTLETLKTVYRELANLTTGFTVIEEVDRQIARKFIGWLEKTETY